VYHKLAWAPDGSGLLAGAVGGAVHFLDSTTGAVVDSIEAHDADVCRMVWAPKKLRAGDKEVAVLATGSADKRVRLWAAPAAAVAL